jgi:hypothetical protein
VAVEPPIISSSTARPAQQRTRPALTGRPVTCVLQIRP